MAKNSKLALLDNLTAARQSKQERFSRNLDNLKIELKPANLFDRISRSAGEKASIAGDRIVQKARTHPATIFAIGSTLLAAIAFKPAKSLIDRFVDDSASDQDYEEI